MPSAKEILAQFWGYQEFRHPQEEIITSVLERKDTLAILPTGGGKSLCYQVPALLLKGMTLVISPLIALMQDQVNHLTSIGIGAELINSQLNPDEIANVMARCALGKVKLLYVAPERLQNKNFIRILENLPIELIAVDEAHCIAQWGHDFRPSYLKIQSVKQLFPKATFLALTATAPLKTQQEIVEALELKSPQIFKLTLKRKNLVFKVIPTQNELDGLVYQLKKNPGAALVFCRTRRQTFELSQFLIKNGFNADFFHARLPIEEKKMKQETWTKSSNQIMLATNAFGMGINKADVRLVVHMDFPNSLEAYVQEAGRAGRDGKNSEAVLFLQANAVEEAEKIFKANLPSRNEFEFVERMFYNYFEIGENERPEDKRELNWTDFLKKFNLTKKKAEKVLFFLERKEVIAFHEQTAYSSVQVFVNPNNFQSQLGIRFKVLEALVRRYPGILSSELAISEFSIARDIQESVRDVKLELKKLAESAFIQYRTRDIQWVSFLRPRESNFIKNNLWKEFVAYQVGQWKKLQEVIYYTTQDDVCREKLILRYFGENPKENCGQCDVCKKEKSPKFDNQMLLEYLESSSKNIHQITLFFSRFSKQSILNALQLLVDEEKIVQSGIDSFKKK